MVGRGIVFADRRARLHRIDHDAVVRDVHARDMGRVIEGFPDGVGIAVEKVERDIARRLVIELRRVRLQGIGHIGDAGEGVDIDHHGFGRVLGLGLGFRHHDGDGIADETDPVEGQGEARRAVHLRAVAILEGQGAFQCAIARFPEIGAREDGQDAGHRQGILGIDALDLAMGIRAAHHGRIGLAGAVEVVGILALAAQQHGVLRARDRLPDAEFHGGEFVFADLGVHDVSRGFDIWCGARDGAAERLRGQSKV